MNPSPLVSVIMPVYNTENYIAQALESILNQTYTNLEILIADDSSNDNSRRIIDSYKDDRIRTFHNEFNLGYLKTCNKLFELVEGSYIAFQDADDWSDINRIESTLSFLLQNPSIGMCGCNFVRLNEENNKVMSKSNYPTSDLAIKNYIEKYNNLPFCGASVILKKSIYDDIGGYKEFFDRIGVEHYDWFMRISEEFQVANLSQNFYYYRYLTNSFSRVNKLNDYKKYFAKDIAIFLRDQRIIYGKDSLTDKTLEVQLDNFLDDLYNDFIKNRTPVYKSVVKNNLSNYNFKEALKVLKFGVFSREIDFGTFFYLSYRIFRSLIGYIFKR